MSLAKKISLGRRTRGHHHWVPTTVIMLIPVLLVLAGLSAARVPTLPVPSGLAAQDGANNIFIIEEQIESGAYRLLVVDPASFEVQQSRPVGDRPQARVSADRRTLYLVDTDWDTNRHTLSALDTTTLEARWHIDLPVVRSSFVARPNDGLWLSADGQFVYLAATIDEVVPHITVIDTHAHTIVREFHIPLPYPATWRFPVIHQVPWLEQLAVVSGDRLFFVDLRDGQHSDQYLLPFFQDTDRIPQNLPQGVMLTYAGMIDPLAQQLVLTTTAQDIIVIDLAAGAVTPRRVLTLPAGWQFSSFMPPQLQPEEETIYLPVRRTNARTAEPEEVWIYDTRSWTQQARVALDSQDHRVDGPPILNDVVVYPVSARNLLLLGQAGTQEMGAETLTAARPA